MRSTHHRSPQEIEDAIGQLLAGAAAIHRQALALIVRFDISAAWKNDGAATLEAWLQTRFGMDQRTATDHVRVAAALGDLPSLAESYEQGLLSWDQLRQVTRFATTETDEELAQIAPRYSASQLQRMAARSEQVTRRRGAADRQRRRLTYRWDDSGRTLRLSGRIPGADGALVYKALHRIATDAPADPETGEFEHYSARSADALVRLASQHIAQDADADRATIVVHVDADTLATGRGPVEIEDGPTISSESLRRIACDSRVQLIVDGRDGQPVGIGRTSRTIPGWLRRQINFRDAGCQFGGCGRTRWLHAHHIKHWSDGGPTDIDNLITLCIFHHRLLHEGGWSVRLVDGRFVWRRPDGTVFESKQVPIRPDIRRRIVEPVLVAAGAGPP